MADVGLSNLNKQFLIAGVPLSVLGGIADGEGVSMDPQGDRRVGMRGLYGDGVWIDQMNEGHFLITVQAMETSQVNTSLHLADATSSKVKVYYTDGSGTTRSGDAKVKSQPSLKVSSSVVIHTWTLESFNFKGTIAGRSL